MEIFTSLDNYDFIESYEVLLFKSSQTAVHFKLKVVLVNKTILFVKEFLSQETRDYAYHWQDHNNKTIIRWDNTPHHTHIKTFPFHKHKGESEQVEDSEEMFLSNVLEHIEAHLLH